MLLLYYLIVLCTILTQLVTCVLLLRIRSENIVYLASNIFSGSLVAVTGVDASVVPLCASVVGYQKNKPNEIEYLVSLYFEIVFL